MISFQAANGTSYSWVEHSANKANQNLCRMVNCSGLVISLATITQKVVAEPNKRWGPDDKVSVTKVAACKRWLLMEILPYSICPQKVDKQCLVILTF